jgi:anti-sigma factor RsiW
MNLDTLQRKLIAAARAEKPSDRVPLAFEKRIMARLEGACTDLLGAWSRALWRAAFGCVVIMLLSGVLSLWTNPQNGDADFSQEFETAVFASAEPVDEPW